MKSKFSEYSYNILKNKTIFLTGATGTFGSYFLKKIYTKQKLKKLYVLVEMSLNNLI